MAGGSFRLSDKPASGSGTQRAGQAGGGLWDVGYVGRY